MAGQSKARRRIVGAAAVFLGLAAAPASAEPALFGVAEGAYARLECSDGRWMTGFVGREGALVDQLAVACAHINLRTLSAIPPAAIVGPHGGGGGRPKSVWCDNGTLPGGLDGYWDPGTRAIKNVQLACLPYSSTRASQRPTTSDVCAGFRCPRSRRLGGPDENASYGVSRCDVGQAMVGVEVWASRYVHGVRPICR